MPPPVTARFFYRVVSGNPDVVQNTQQGKRKQVIGEIEKETGSLTEHWINLKK